MPDKEELKQVEREELALKNRTAEAVSNMFRDGDTDARDPYEFSDEVELPGVWVTLAFEDGTGMVISGADFVNGVWEAIADA